MGLIMIDSRDKAIAQCTCIYIYSQPLLPSERERGRERTADGVSDYDAKARRVCNCLGDRTSRACVLLSAVFAASQGMHFS